MDKDLTVADLCSKLQALAHEGYAIHTIEMHTTCNDCESKIILSNPKIDFIIQDTKTVKMVLHNES